jgi:imidazolonepropionase-like amidohydrolase
MLALEEAGVPRDEIIKASTSRAAKMLKIDADVGSVSEGKVADLIILEQNPLASFRGLKHIRWVVRNGVAKSPAEWVQKDSK